MLKQSVAMQMDDAGSLSSENFAKLASYIYRYSGIKLPVTKHIMLEGRLRRRLKANNIGDFDGYCDFLFNKNGLEKEAIHLIDAVTTNKTDFFREPVHFDHMKKTALPEFYHDGVRRLRLWSAASSIGAEAYTMAMLCAEFTLQNSAMDYFILATDLSTEVLRAAHRGVYTIDMMEPVSNELKKKYVMMSKDPVHNEVRIHPSLRSKIGFARMNLMDERYLINKPMHIIFCRNVLIYFDRKTQLEVVERLCDCLVQGGYLYVGHSETISNLDLPLKAMGRNVFKKI